MDSDDEMDLALRALAEQPGAPPDPAAAGRDPPRRGRHRRGVRDDAFDREAEGITPTDGAAWGAARHTLWAPRLLTVDDPRAPNPPGFKGRLYPPQATLLAAMCALERRPLLGLSDGRCPPEWSPHLQTKYGRISERFSFGKTVLSLALVCAQKVPARLPELMPLISCPLSGNAARSANRACVATAPVGGNFDPVGLGFLPEVSLRCERYLRLTAVAAAANVISQWEAEAQRFTDLRFFTVENVRSLREFEALYRRGQAADLDLLFVKAGRVTASFVVDGEPKPEAPRAKNRSLFEALARVLEGVPVARLIIDDYDTLKLGSDDCFLPALFTWLVSATRRQTTAKYHLRTGAATAAEFFRQNAAGAFPILGAALDDVLNKVCSLHCAPSYVDAHIGSTAVGFRRIYVRGGQAAAILRDLEVPDEVVEMVNANAVGTAAQTLGLTASSIGDVIRRVVGVHLDKLRHAVRTLARTERARAALGAKGGDEKNREVIRALRAALKDGSDEEADAALRAAAGLGPAVSAALQSLDEWASEQHEKHGKALGRMRDNIREGHCQCCMIPFEPGEEAEAAYVLAGCCQIIVCEPCITKKVGAGKAFIKRCPNCARDIQLETGLVRVGAELDLEAALKDEAIIDAGAPAKPAAAEPAAAEPAAAEPTAEPAAAGPAAAEPAAADPLDDLNDPKLKVLVQFARGSALDCIRDELVPPYVDGLLDGRRDAPWPAGKARKVLVFTMHAESTRAIAAALERFAVPFCILRGTRAQKDEAVRRLREEVGVMLVTAPGDCGGLNLPFLSHVVFFHRVLDRNVEAQVAARGQRLGREHNLEIVTLVNEAEAEGLPVR